MAFVDTQVRPQGEQQKVGKLKLSEAIKRGIKKSLSSREYGARVWVVKSGGHCFACVIGAAWLGSGGDNHFLSSRFPELAEKCGVSTTLLIEGERRYEQQGQSREEVADWLESQGL